MPLESLHHSGSLWLYSSRPPCTSSFSCRGSRRIQQRKVERRKAYVDYSVRSKYLGPKNGCFAMVEFRHNTAHPCLAWACFLVSSQQATYQCCSRCTRRTPSD